MGSAIGFTILCLVVLTAPVWFHAARFAYVNKFKDGRNIRVSVNQVPDNYGTEGGTVYSVRWCVEGPERRWDSWRKSESGYTFSGISVDDAFAKANDEVERAIKKLKPQEKMKLASYSYEVDESGSLVNMKENR